MKKKKSFLIKILKDRWAEILNAPIVAITAMWTMVKMGNSTTIGFAIPFGLFFVSGTISIIMAIWRMTAKDMSIDPDKN